MDRSELLAIIEKAKQSNQTSLDLSGKWIKELPESIGQLTHLTSLNLMGNRLTSLPESIGQLINLISLDLRFNLSRVNSPSLGTSEETQKWLFHTSSACGEVLD